MTPDDLQIFLSSPLAHSLKVASIYTLIFLSLDKLLIPLTLKPVHIMSELQKNNLESFFIRMFMLMTLITLTIFEHLTKTLLLSVSTDYFMYVFGLVLFVSLMFFLMLIELVIFNLIVSHEEKYQPQSLMKKRSFFQIKNFRQLYETPAYYQMSKRTNLVLYIASFIHLVLFIH